MTALNTATVCDQTVRSTVYQPGEIMYAYPASWIFQLSVDLAVRLTAVRRMSTDGGEKHAFGTDAVNALSTPDRQ